MKNNAKNFILDILFPKFCVSCKKEGNFLCPDCQALLEISSLHQRQKTKNLSDLYWPCDYQNNLAKKLIEEFKYEPFVKELCQPLSSLIVSHLKLIEKENKFSDFCLVPVPLDKKRLKRRGYNQAEEIARQLSIILEIPLISDVLIKTKSTRAQADLGKEERAENPKGAFSVKNAKKVKNKKILLVDDVYTTGATMAECAKTLQEAGAREIIGIAVCRSELGQKI